MRQAGIKKCLGMIEPIHLMIDIIITTDVNTVSKHTLYWSQNTDKGFIADNVKQKIFDECKQKRWGKIVAMETHKDHIHFLIEGGVIPLASAMGI